MGNKVKPTYRLRAKFEVDNMQILEGDNLVTANTFYIRDGHKSVEIYTQTRREKEEWLAALFEAIKELYQRKSSLKIGREILRPCDSEIGKKQPHILKLEAIHKCMECAQPFSMMRKKYNCRACGVVVCGKCSGQKQPMAFEDNKPCRVCKSCHQVILNRNNEKPSETTESSEALTATPIPGHTVVGGATELRGDSLVTEKERDKVVKLFYQNSQPVQSNNNNSSNSPVPLPVAARKVYYLTGNSCQEMERWTKVLKLASKAELQNLDEDLESSQNKADLKRNSSFTSSTSTTNSIQSAD